MTLLVAAKVLLGGLLLVGVLYPRGPFEGKGMADRLPAFLLPGLIWAARRVLPPGHRAVGLAWMPQRTP